ncbi:hypothetical protein LRS10_21785 [Phenylobacterium sp. J426]|uniref:hypothetical protein n=1 Tax=Phenylobacterium sp. J426 TaxID=2898439 RepID=UPI002151BEC3|nr:hypothetical protein [Phenylobacterium sp. J426]MCR5876543.1 hypothetical protein [Phenylobacterium sp. J426]
MAERLRCDRAEFLRQYERLTAQPARGPKDELGRLTHLLLLSLQQREDLAFWLAREVQDAAPRPPIVGDLFDDKTQG